jgi:SAM-dependent methyltransferase
MQTRPVAAGESPERFDPAVGTGTLVHAEHVARYWWAAHLTAGLDVLDAGCGTGYGTAILAGSKPRRLLAFDIAQEAVDATQAAVGDAAEVGLGDVGDLPIADDSVDVVVCFEVIEHVEQREDAVREFARVLRPGGVLLISSPNRNQYPSGNEHHVYEYTPDELEQELHAEFANVELYRQHAWLGTVIAADDDLAAGAGADARLHVTRSDVGEETFTVAIAGDGELPRPTARVTVGDAFEITWWHEQLNEHRRIALAAEREIRVRETRLAELGARLLES